MPHLRIEKGGGRGGGVVASEPISDNYTDHMGVRLFDF